MELVDTHCHLTGLESERVDLLLQDAHNCGVTRFICVDPGEGPESSDAVIKLAEQHSDVWATIGIHPHSAGSFTDLNPVEHFLSHPKVVALGEVGLDFYRDWAPKENQLLLFRQAIETAKKYKKKLIVHSRHAAEETLRLLIEGNAAQVGGVFHCYAEDAAFARKLAELNFSVSFTGALTFKNGSALRNAAREIPLPQIMLETDCPYMAPEPFRGQKSEPKHVLQVAQKLAEVRGITVDEAARATTENARRIFGV
jgi:TatD DNase family protein